MHQKFSNIPRIAILRLFFFSSFNSSWVINSFGIFHWTKVEKHIWEPCCHIVAETCTWFILSGDPWNQIYMVQFL